MNEAIKSDPQDGGEKLTSFCFRTADKWPPWGLAKLTGEQWMPSLILIFVCVSFEIATAVPMKVKAKTP